MKIFRILKYIYFFIFGYIFALLLYDKKYLKTRLFKHPKNIIVATGWRIAYFDFINRLITGNHRKIPFPTHPSTVLTNYKTIYFHENDLHLFQSQNCYFQSTNESTITIGEGTWIGPNVGIITSNHDKSDLHKHMTGKDINIGKRCWLGMNSIVLPGVTIGDNTIIGAGAVVTKSFPEGNCVLVGNPASKKNKE